MKKIRNFIVFLILVSILVPFNAFAFIYTDENNAPLYYDDIPDLSTYYMSALRDYRNLILYYDTSNSNYYLIVYSFDAQTTYDVRLSSGDDYYFDTHILYYHVYYWNSSNHILQDANFNSFNGGSKVLLCAYFTKHPDDNSYYNAFNPWDGSRSTVNVPSYPFYFNNDGSLDYIGHNSGGSGSGGTSVNVDMTPTNNILTNILNKLDLINTNLVAFKNDVSSKLTTINSTINTNFTNLQTYLTGKYQTLYNVIIYGSQQGAEAIEEQEMQLEEFSTDLGDINTSVSGASDFIDSAGSDVASYISTFTDFYNGMAALNGLTAVLSFGLVIIVIKKMVGR